MSEGCFCPVVYPYWLFQVECLSCFLMRIINLAIYWLMANFFFYSALGHSGLHFILLLQCDARMILLLLQCFSHAFYLRLDGWFTFISFYSELIPCKLVMFALQFNSLTEIFLLCNFNIFNHDIFPKLLSPLACILPLQFTLLDRKIFLVKSAIIFIDCVGQI